LTGDVTAEKVCLVGISRSRQAGGERLLVRRPWGASLDWESGGERKDWDCGRGRAEAEDRGE
jgi:hypothetical protein